MVGLNVGACVGGHNGGPECTTYRTCPTHDVGPSAKILNSGNATFCAGFNIFRLLSVAIGLSVLVPTRTLSGALAVR